ncbi:hypothetical protein BTM25_57810 [Actinomadura rubteroloni]|uniref:SCP2 domain-containing protein n=1 Tax=Actinomadura rubteroloni TaxID=1926885 RepID=A0A2P4UBE2_9ACTN|nr:SCP2 sterol-binding domain-containing protein [Actinomadura rubteroloni]POM22369.1 hypothetical protein BTM25_57810 [Actinomadura rubteroloni]
MANEDECRAALDRVAARLSDVDPERFAEHVVERTITCRIPDLGIAFATRVHPGGLDPVQRTEDPSAGQVRLTVNSDDLVALADDRLNPARAWTSGRLRVEASFTDLLRLRKAL